MNLQVLPQYTFYLHPSLPLLAISLCPSSLTHWSLISFCISLSHHKFFSEKLSTCKRNPFLSFVVCMTPRWEPWHKDIEDKCHRSWWFLLVWVPFPLVNSSLEEQRMVKTRIQSYFSLTITVFYIFQYGLRRHHHLRVKAKFILRISC